jgi:hypothetical protein
VRQSWISSQPSSLPDRSDLDRSELVAVDARRTDGQPPEIRVSVILDFPRQISAVEDWRFLDLSGTGSGRRILGSVPQFLSRSVQSINRLIGPAARIVSAREDLLACFGYGRVAIFL